MGVAFTRWGSLYLKMQRRPVSPGRKQYRHQPAFFVRPLVGKARVVRSGRYLTIVACWLVADVAVGTKQAEEFDLRTPWPGD